LYYSLAQNLQQGGARENINTEEGEIDRAEDGTRERVIKKKIFLLSRLGLRSKKKPGGRVRPRARIKRQPSTIIEEKGKGASRRRCYKGKLGKRPKEKQPSKKLQTGFHQ